MMLLTILPVSVEPLAKMNTTSPQEPFSSSLDVEEPLIWRRVMGLLLATAARSHTVIAVDFILQRKSAEVVGSKKLL